MLKFDESSNFYSKYLEVINPKGLGYNNVPDEILISYDNSGKKFVHHKSLSVALFSSSNSVPQNRDVEITFKVESAFHCLVSKLYADYPNLNGANFYKLGQEIKGTDDATVVLIEIFNILRLIRNKFHHDKFGGLSWSGENKLEVNGNQNLIITEHGVRLCVYIIWYCLKNNMKYLYNRVVLNYLYTALINNVEQISYGSDDKKTTSLKSLENPWKTSTHYNNRNIVRGDIIKPIEGGYLINRQNCLIEMPFTKESGEVELKKTCYRRLDYNFEINEIEYLIPDEYFFDKEDGVEAFIGLDELSEFIYLPKEIANF
ncbi:hypothetical protein [Acinetobacter bereziniae]|uniref:hypothetical protein n=1 Tax=Acinetobacter bereziniae TaxID=106648 RepID=UPI003019F3A8